MRKGIVKLAAAMCAGALLLSGCGIVPGTSNDEVEKVRLMVWSPSEDQSKDSGQWLQTCCEKFADLHPEWDITFVYGVSDEASAGVAVAQDPDASADVFMFPNDGVLPCGMPMLWLSLAESMQMSFGLPTARNCWIL